MASWKTSFSGREKKQPVVGGQGPFARLAGHPHRMETWAESSGSLLSSIGPDGLHSSPHGPLPPAPSASTRRFPLNQEVSSLQPVRQFIPSSWKAFFQRRWQRWREPWADASLVAYAPEGVNCSPPVSPFLERSQRTTLDLEERLGESGEDGSVDLQKLPSSSSRPSKSGEMVTPTSHGDLSTGPPSYREKLAAYDHKYSYMKSWPGLLRLLGGLELVLGGMVFACTAAYIQKDYQWSQLYGGSMLPSNGILGGGYGYNYYGPMTPFVLVVASLVWLLTVILLGLGVTMYYRTILLDSHWWPLTEFALNLIMFLLYMAAAIAYVNDVNRGGLCYSVFASNPLVVALCRVEGGQVAAIAFLFITMMLYLVGALVCLKMWRHEAFRKSATALQKPISFHVTPKEVFSQEEPLPSGKVTRRVEFSEKGEEPKMLNSAIPTGHNPKPHVVPDYVIKYPAIESLEDREKYKAVFRDQYAEYKELYCDVHTALQKLKELEAMMHKLPLPHRTRKDQNRVSAVWRDYKSKKEDPAFLEKQQRCDYLKRKLSHLKVQIRAYDRETAKESVFF